MKYWYFSECAYPYLPPEEEYDSIRVTLPNGYMDPVKAADLWHRYIDEWQAAEGYGLGLMINEHHSTATCANPSAPIIAGILARATTTARILILGNPIANRPDPVRVAEEMALIDVISRGRLECGFVRGVPYEISATNTYPIDMSARFWEAHDLILKAWTTHDGPFSWTGKFFEHRQVNIWPRPYQQPRPPVWVTTTTPSGSAKIAEHGHTHATFLVGKNMARTIFGNYRTRRKEMGLETSVDKLAYCGLVFVADSEEAARKGSQELMWYATANKVKAPFQVPSGYMPPEARLRMLAGDARDPNALKAFSQDELIDQAIMFSGTPDQVYNQIKTFYDYVGGFGNLLIMGQAGFLGHKQTVRSMQLFSESVAPRLDILHPGIPQRLSA